MLYLAQSSNLGGGCPYRASYGVRLVGESISSGEFEVELETCEDGMQTSFIVGSIISKH